MQSLFDTNFLGMRLARAKGRIKPGLSQLRAENMSCIFKMLLILRLTRLVRRIDVTWIVKRVGRCVSSVSFVASSLCARLVIHFVVISYLTH